MKQKSKRRDESETRAKVPAYQCSREEFEEYVKEQEAAGLVLVWSENDSGKNSFCFKPVDRCEPLGLRSVRGVFVSAYQVKEFEPITAEQYVEAMKNIFGE